jgi:hypothetical protein
VVLEGADEATGNIISRCRTNWTGSGSSVEKPRCLRYRLFALRHATQQSRSKQGCFHEASHYLGSLLSCRNTIAQSGCFLTGTGLGDVSKLTDIKLGPVGQAKKVMPEFGVRSDQRERLSKGFALPSRSLFFGPLESPTPPSGPGRV